MITNASDKPISYSAVPNVEDALSGWLRKVIVGKIVKTIVDFEVQESRDIYEIFAVRQPFTTKQLAIMPEGQRAWQWENLHVRGSEMEFCLDDQVFIDGKKYRIMQKWKWADRGYINYFIVEDWGQIETNSVNESVSISESEQNDP